jgi:hypothetical protein
LYESMTSKPEVMGNVKLTTADGKSMSADILEPLMAQSQCRRSVGD